MTGHESAKDWQAFFFYVKNDTALETSGYPAFTPTAAEENEYWTGRGAQPTNPRLLRCIRRIDQVMIDNLRGLDLVLCWAKRRVQTLQHRKKLLCQYNGKKDEMRTKADDLSQDAIDHRMKDIVKLRDTKHGFKVVVPMPENDKITTVSTAAPFSFLF